MAVEQYSVVSHDWVNLEFIINDLTQRVVGQELHPTSTPTFDDLTLTGDLNITGNVDITGDLAVDGAVTLNALTASRLVWTDASKILESKDLIDLIAGTADEIDVADDAAGGVVIGLVDPLIVSKGGTGRATSTTAYGLLAAGTTATGAHQTLAAGLTTQILVGGGAAALPAWGTDIPTAVTIGSAYIYRVGGTDVSVADGGTGASSLTDHGILLGSGTGAVTALGAATNGQLPIGSTGADPVLAAITGGTGITVANGAGSITLSTTDGEIVHNSLSGLQGGTAGEYYHLTAAEHTELTAWLDDVTLSDGGAVDLGTGTITAANYTAANLLTACATNAGALDFSAVSKTLIVEDNAVVSQDYSTDASPTFATVDLTGITDSYHVYMGASGAGFGTSILHENVSGQLSTNSVTDKFGVLNIRGTPASAGDLMTVMSVTDGNTAYGSSPAAGIMFRSKYNTAGDIANLSGIAGGKENTTDGNYASFVGLYTRANGSTPKLRLLIDSAGSTYLGDGGSTNYAQFATDGELTLVGTARVQKEFQLAAVDLSPGASGATLTNFGNYYGYAFTVSDDMIATFEVPHDWDSTTDLNVVLYWAIDEAYATNSGEVQWQVAWAACPPDATEAIDAPTHTGTIDYGDQNIPATAKYLTKTGDGAIAAASLAADDLVGLTISRVALDDGSNPTAEPIIFHIEVHYTANKLGEAT